MTPLSVLKIQIETTALDNPSLISNTPVEHDVCDYGLNGDNLDWLRRPSTLV